MIVRLRKLWLCRAGSAVVIVQAQDREGAKRNARSFLAGDPDKYTVTLLTNETDTVQIVVVI